MVVYSLGAVMQEWSAVAWWICLLLGGSGAPSLATGGRGHGPDSESIFYGTRRA